MPLPAQCGPCAVARHRKHATAWRAHVERRRCTGPGLPPARLHNEAVNARWLLLALAAWSLAAASVPASTAPTGLQREVVFGGYPPFADDAELLRRLVSPLDALRIEQRTAGHPGALHAAPIDPARQHFALYVPAGAPPATGYGLLVFVPPWNDARVPVDWIPALDRTHTIFVTAAGSGNDAGVLNRRDPLALLAAYGVMRRYRVDPARVFVGGFSGGSRIALRLSLGYPDLFRGALLDAGSDPIGSAEVPLPPVELFRRFQQSSRIVFVTGADDAIRQAQLANASDALQRWCVFDTDSITLLHTGHALADAAGFARGLDALLRPVAPDATRLASCRARNRAAMDADLQRARALIHAGQAAQALRSLEAIDARYGGLAGSAIRSLLGAIGAQAGKPSSD